MGQTLARLVLASSYDPPNNNDMQQPQQRHSFIVTLNTPLFLRNTDMLQQLPCYMPNAAHGYFRSVVQSLHRDGAHHDDDLDRDNNNALHFSIAGLVLHAPVQVVHHDGTFVLQIHRLVRMRVFEPRNGHHHDLFMEPNIVAHFFTPFPPNHALHQVPPENWTWCNDAGMPVEDGQRLAGAAAADHHHRHHAHPRQKEPLHRERAPAHRRQEYLSAADDDYEFDDDDDEHHRGR